MIVKMGHCQKGIIEREGDNLGFQGKPPYGHAAARSLGGGNMRKRRKRREHFSRVGSGGLGKRGTFQGEEPRREGRGERSERFFKW